MNWKIFELKYDNREQWAFEHVSYLLFCTEFGIKTGLFRYKNQTGIETEPIEKDGVNYGFQAKYYTSTISQKKDDIIDSIQKAKSKNNQLNVIYLYLNQELSESSKTNKKKPQYQSDIEQAAKKIGINVQWRVPSHFELQIALPENKFIYDIFFNLDSSGENLIDDVYKHNENILRAIQTEINFIDKQIKIDRCDIIDQITQTIDNNQNIIISGEGGCGKTAILKEFYNKIVKEIPICIFKATELNVNHINDLFRFENDFTFSQFLETFQSEPKKIFVIDSAEKLAESTNNDILINLIQTLKDNGWIIVFTTRYSYLNDLSFHIKENYHLSCEIIDIPIISNDDLKKISTVYNFNLPDNQNFLERLRNLFYLNEYIQYYSNIDKQGDFRSFIDLLWRKRIQNSFFKKDNLHIERERCIIFIAKERCETGFFYINAEKLNQPALFQLKQDEILGYDETHDGYFITHDIYEEWALNKVVSRYYANFVSSRQFFEDLGSSLAIRRAFRMWLSEQLFENIDKIENFVIDTFRNVEVTQFWKDELLVSVLLSDYSETFFVLFEKEIIAGDFKILARILFLLRIACTEISTTKDYDFIKPKGKGWDVVIAFIYKFKTDFFEKNLNLILPILTDWCNNCKEGKTTRFAGLLALSLIEKKATTEYFYIHRDSEEPILKVIYNAVKVLKSELLEIFDKVITYKWNKHNSPYEELVSKMLEKPYLALEVIKVLPKSVIQLCNMFWRKRLRADDEFGYERDSMENKYGLVDEFKYNYFPASAYQSPIYWLLQNDFNETLDFIIDFTNRSVESYRQSVYGKKDVEEINLHIKEQEVQQYLCWAFWGMYRGIGSPVVPNLLESMHMALEKILLEYAKILKLEIIEQILFQILIKSKSASLTAVVCSIVLANPDKLYNIALVLFGTIELFHMDLMRCTNEFQVKSLCSIWYGLDKVKDTFYTDERLKTCEDKHRSLNLESLFLNYQIFGIMGFSEEQNTKFIQKLHNILDEYKVIFSTKPEYISKSFGILLARMDRRNLTAKVTKQDDNNFVVELNPTNLSDELREQSNQATKQFENSFKYSSLRLWADFINGNKYENSTQKSKQYDSDPLLALAETKQLVLELKTGRVENGMFDHSIPAYCCSKLMIEHNDKLSQVDKDFCKEIILTTVSRLFFDDYDYQICDGVEASVHAIPYLISEYPDEKENLILIMVLSLLDVTSIGQYKRICDYVYESVHESKLWDLAFDDAQAILLGYIKLKPIYNKIYNERRKEKGIWGNIPKSFILHELDKQLAVFSFFNISFDDQNLDSFDIQDFELIFQLIPSNTIDKIHTRIYEKSLRLILPRLLIDRRSYEDEFGKESNIYLSRLYIFRRFSKFILEREIDEIDAYLKPFIDNFVATEETSSLLDEIIGAEDNYNKYEQFWSVWNKLYPTFINVCKNSNGFNLDKVIESYLLAWQWWRDGVEEWHSLKEENLLFYTNIVYDLSHIPTVLYSITKMLNSIGSKYTTQGIDWIYTIISNNNSLKMGDLESNTLYYLERYLRKFIFLNSEQIKKDVRLKIKIIPILEFMIERASLHGYLLRESIL